MQVLTYFHSFKWYEIKSFKIRSFDLNLWLFNKYCIRGLTVTPFFTLPFFFDIENFHNKVLYQFLELYAVCLKVWVKKWDTLKSWPLIKNPLEFFIFTKFHENRTKIVDFLLVANFWTCLGFLDSDFTFENS